LRPSLGERQEGNKNGLGSFEPRARFANPNPKRPCDFPRLLEPIFLALSRALGPGMFFWRQALNAPEDKLWAIERRPKKLAARL